MSSIRRVAWVSILSMALVTAACGTPQPSRPATSPDPSAASGSVDPTVTSTPTPSVTAPPTSSPSPTPTARPPAQPTIALQARGRSSGIQVAGTIDVAGIPLAGALLQVEAIPLDGRVQTVQLKGTVPADAKTAHVGIRVNIEDIAEPGPANITIYRASYSQGGGRNRVPNPGMRPNTNHWGLHEDGITVRRSDIGPGLMIRIRDTAKMRTIINTGGFRVTPGASYKATMLLKVTASTVGHAYFTVTWLSDVTEIGRERLDLEPAPIRLPDRKATSEGRFKARFDDLSPGRYRIVVRYAGDATHLATEVTEVVRIR